MPTGDSERSLVDAPADTGVWISMQNPRNGFIQRRSCIFRENKNTFYTKINANAFVRRHALSI